MPQIRNNTTLAAPTNAIHNNKAKQQYYKFSLIINHVGSVYGETSSLGTWQRIGTGGFGSVWKDTKNPGYVIKVGDCDENESNFMNKYYGAGFSQFHKSHDGRNFITMREVPGIPYEKLSPKQRKSPAIHLALAALYEKLLMCNIRHGDLSEGNLLVNCDKGTDECVIHPIDFAISKDLLQRAPEDFLMDEYQFSLMLESQDKKLKTVFNTLIEADNALFNKQFKMKNNEFVEV